MSMCMRSVSIASSLTSAMLTERKMFSRSLSTRTGAGLNPFCEPLSEWTISPWR